MQHVFGSLITAIVTPFDQNGKVNFEKLSTLTNHLADHGSDGLVVTGTTGESPTLTFEEKVHIYKQAVGSVKGKCKIIAGTGGNSTKETIRLSQAAEKAGVHGIMLVVPYYNKPTQEGLFQHFKAIAESISIPIMLYNVPGRTGVNLQGETTVKLAEQFKHIVAIKEASANLDQITYICSSTPEGFAVYSGDDSMTLPILSVGGVGVVSISSHLIGLEMKDMIQSFFQGNVRQAIEINQKYFPLFKGLFVKTNPIPLKSALNLTGFEVGKPRMPLLPLEDHLEAELKSLLQDLAII